MELLHQSLSCGDLNPSPMSSAMVSLGPGAISSCSCFPSFAENFTLLSRVRNKPYDVFGCWLNETNLISGNLHRIGRITSCSVLWLNNAFQVRCLCSSSTGSVASCWLLGEEKLQRRCEWEGMAQSSCPPCLSSLTCPQDPELEAALV